jgi:hypothetical protein
VSHQRLAEDYFTEYFAEVGLEALRSGWLKAKPIPRTQDFVLLNLVSFYGIGTWP